VTERSVSTRLPTFVGISTVLMWAFLALLTAATGTVPPFQLAAMSFVVGAAIGLGAVLRHPRRFAVFRQPPLAWAVGVGGLFGYHALYFTALRNAPPIEAGLIAYLWPLLIVLFSGLLPSERLRAVHVAGALLGLAGAALVMTGGGLEIKWQFWFGYAAALCCAFTWSSYSVLSRLFRGVETEYVAGLCLAAAVLSALCHLGFEETVWPRGAVQWLAVLGLGLFPLGLAFYTWDYGVKRGNIQIIGVASFATPLLSTIVLILFGDDPFTWSIGLACVLIVGGIVLATRGR